MNFIHYAFYVNFVKKKNQHYKNCIKIQCKILYQNSFKNCTLVYKFTQNIKMSYTVKFVKKKVSLKKLFAKSAVSHKKLKKIP